MGTAVTILNCRNTRKSSNSIEQQEHYTIDMEERRDELLGFTVDRIRELCTKVHIKTYGKTKDKLIAQLLEVKWHH